jgi:hypothetical protein
MAWIENHFEEAALKYSEALEHNPFDATLFCNRKRSTGFSAKFYSYLMED